MQEEIATSIAGALNVALLTGDQEGLDYRPTENLDAYDYFLRAKDSWDRDHFLKAIELLDKATDLDSSFAMAFASRLNLRVKPESFMNLECGILRATSRSSDGSYAR